MDSSDTNFTGNGPFHGEAYRGHGSGRQRTKPRQTRNPRGNEIQENNLSSVNFDRRHAQDVDTFTSTTDNLTSSAPSNPKGGRGFYSGPPGNGYRRPSQGNHQFRGNSRREDYGLHSNPLSDHQPNQSRHHFSRKGYTQTHNENVTVNQSRELQTIPRTGQAPDFDGNAFSEFSSYTGVSTDVYSTTPSDSYAGPVDSYLVRGNSTRPKQTRGPKKQKPRNNDYRKTYGQNENVEGATAIVFENSSLQTNYSTSTSGVQPNTTLEHQPFENIRREYSQYRGRPTFSDQQYENSSVSRSVKEKFRRGEKGGGFSSQERFSREENSGSYDSRDRFRKVESSKAPVSNNRDQLSYNKPARLYDSQNWRSDGFKKGISAQKQKAVEPPADTATQRERLTTQLTSGTYECMVCCESVKPAQPIWNCSQCYHAFHLGCVRRWSRTSQDESGQWRCPGCQWTNKSLPNAYFCYCSKRKDPEWNRRETPHSCGEVCGKSLGDGISCTHSCTLLCHPGPCPTCSAQTQRKCPCGKSSQIVKCGSSDALLCGQPCEKQLSCGLHVCQESCHVSLCETCPLTVKQTCFCGQTNRELSCSIDHLEEDKFSCDLVCRKKLSCGRHECEKICHSGDCGACPLEVATISHCPCGKVQLKQLYKTKVIPERKLCTDPIPVCGKICGKILPCGPSENPHSCGMSCHAGPCPTCPLTSELRCRCGRNEKKIPCKNICELGDILCERRCNKKRQCGRHKCAQVCCIDKEHICPMVCGRTLSCGLDRCEALCHAGNCNRCYRVSFDELRCHCGTQVMYPPVPCGTRPPDCNKPCTRARPCGHPPSHNCHPDANGCPPCTTLCEKFCYGKHEKRKNIPCHLTEVSCGKSCGRAMKCGRHSCLVNCHAGPCPVVCTQPCPIQRSDCDHSCGLPCHEGSCPGTPCREKVKVQCQCGQRTATVSCEENEISYRKMATGLLASKMAQLQSGESVDLKDLLGKSAANKTKSLECNEECALIERNRRLALALQIKNPNPKPGAPPYPDILKEWAKKDQRFVQMVHDKLTELVQLAKQSIGKMKSRSHSFDSMNRDKRQFIHEYCVFFGCESMSYDDEPKRNVVATAFGEMSFLPAVSILDVARREMGQRKMPAPPRGSGLTVLTSGLGPQLQQQQTSQPTQSSQPQKVLTNAWGGGASSLPFRTLSDVVKSNPATVKNVPESPAPAKTTEPKAPVVDYFDFTS